MIALLMIGTDCSNAGYLDEAEAALDAVIRSASACSDALHMSAAYNNRAFLWLGRLNPHKLVEDLHRAARLCREAGMPLAEFTKVGNLSEVSYMLDDLESAREHHRRAVDLVRQLFGDASREMSRLDLLLARMAVYQADVEEGLAVVQRIHARMAAARAAGSSEVDFAGTDHFLFEMVELGARNAGETEWEALAARCRDAQLAPYEEVELLEFRALCAVRNGRLEIGREHFRRGIEVSEQKPNLMGDRLKRSYARSCGSQLSG
jgi:hypothetical protein